MQASCGIHNNDIGRARLGGGHCVVNDRRGVGTRFLLDHLDAVALRPDFELFDGRGPKRVCGTKHHTAAFLAKSVRELPNAGGLPCAINANDENHARAAAVL